MLNVQWKLVIFVFCVSLIQPGLGGFQDMINPMSIEFKSWAQCPELKGKTQAEITNAIINRIGPNQVAVTLDINVIEDFGQPEFTMFVNMNSSDENRKDTFVHENDVDVDKMCESLEEDGNIIATAIELMGFPKGTKCPIPAGRYLSEDKKIDIPIIAMAIFEKKRFWDIEIKFINDETKAVHMCFQVMLERVIASDKKRDRSGIGKKGRKG